MLSGHKSLVPAGVGLLLVEAGRPGVTTRSYVLQDGSAAADLDLRAPQPRNCCRRAMPSTPWRPPWMPGLAALCAEAVGAMDQLMAITVDYMNTRKQFGVPIATFQAAHGKYCLISELGDGKRLCAVRERVHS